jgi:hypothetical protein
MFFCWQLPSLLSELNKASISAVAIEMPLRFTKTSHLNNTEAKTTIRRCKCDLSGFVDQFHVLRAVPVPVPVLLLLFLFFKLELFSTLTLATG